MSKQSEAYNELRRRLDFLDTLGPLWEFSEGSDWLAAAYDRVVEEAPGTLQFVDALYSEFLVDRLKVQLRDQGKRHDLVDAALRPGGALDDDLVRIVRRVEALEAFLKTDDGANLLAGYKRAVNILRAEEKKEAGLAESLAADLVNKVEPSGILDAERTLTEVLVGAELAAQHALNSEDFAGAMAALAQLRAPVDAFFDQVLVNDPDPMLRRSRLLLLSKVRAALERVADFSQIEG